MKILIVDDDELTLDLLAGTLQELEGCQVETALSGEEANERIRAGDVPIVISDWMMPGMSGLELCRSVRSMELEHYVHFILVTSRDSVEDVVTGLEAGADEFLNKPIHPMELLARLESVRRFKELNDRVRDQNARLLAAQKLKEDYLNMIVHDLRAPLTGILGYAQLAMRQESAASHRSLNIVIEEASRLNGMLEEMLLMARSEAGRLRLQTAGIDVRKIAEKACLSMGSLASSNGIRLEEAAPPDGLPAVMDGSMIRRVLDNLLSNAIRFAPEGSVVTLGLEQVGAEIRMTVADTGPGVPEEDRERIFDKFKVVRTKVTGKSQHGLGLAFCRMVVEGHGGRIRCLANQPRGALFEIRMPVSPPVDPAEDQDVPVRSMLEEPAGAPTS